MPSRTGWGLRGHGTDLDLAGNILYATRPNEIEQVLEDHGFGNYAQIHVSIDPVSGRNPGYCFVDFNDRETAEAALTSLVATLRGRPLKVGPCQPKQPGQRRDKESRWGPSSREGGSDADRRWGDWKKSTDGRSGSSGAAASTPRSNLDHTQSTNGNDRQEPNSKRVYIGGLGVTVDQDQNQAEITDLLRGFQPVAIGKRITARDRETQEAKPNANYCFVDFETAAEAQKAVDTLNGIPYGDDGAYLRVSHARGYTERSGRMDRNANTNEDGGRHNNYRKRQTADDGAPRALDSMNWRRKD